MGESLGEIDKLNLCHNVHLQTQEMSYFIGKIRVYTDENIENFLCVYLLVNLVNLFNLVHPGLLGNIWTSCRFLLHPSLKVDYLTPKCGPQADEQGHDKEAQAQAVVSSPVEQGRSSAHTQHGGGRKSYLDY